MQYSDGGVDGGSSRGTISLVPLVNDKSWGWGFVVVHILSRLIHIIEKLQLEVGKWGLYRVAAS